jgi:hypothetical protein
MGKVLVLIALVCMSFATESWAQTEKIQPPTLEGRWALENIVLYKYSGNDSIKVTNDLLPEKKLISGVFDTIWFEGNICRVNADNLFFESAYRQNGNVLDILLMAVPHTYIVTKDKTLLTLYRKYNDVDNATTNITVSYGVKLMYQLIK